MGDHKELVMAVPDEAFDLDFSGFDRLLDANRQRLFGIALAILGNPADAEDALQEGLLKAWRAWASLADHAAANAWLTRICVNQCIDHRRGLRLRRAEQADDTTPDARRPQMTEAMLDLDRAFATLSRTQRAVLTLNRRYGYSIDECAELLGCGAGSIRTHIARGMDKLRKEMTR